MRIRRGHALAVAVLTSALVITGCARDTGAGAPPAAGGSGGSSAGECTRNPAPTVAGGAAASSAPAAANADASKLKVGVAYDIGGRGDGSFNDAAAAGLEKAIADLGLPKASTKELAAAANESEDAAATRLRQLVSEGFNPIIAVGFKYATALKTVAEANPQTQFAIVDDSSVELPNVTPLVFAEEQGSFLVGAAAALKTQTCKIGFVGGVEQPLIQKFQAGYVQGAKAVAPDIQVDVKYLSPAGTSPASTTRPRARWWPAASWTAARPFKGAPRPRALSGSWPTRLTSMSTPAPASSCPCGSSSENRMRARAVHAPEQHADPVLGL